MALKKEDERYDGEGGVASPLLQPMRLLLDGDHLGVGAAADVGEQRLLRRLAVGVVDDEARPKVAEDPAKGAPAARAHVL